jgi:V/A-type H+-transporting ATPase subunit I
LKQLKSTAYFIGTISKKYEQQIYDELGNLSAEVYIEIVSDSFQDVNLFILCQNSVVSDVSDILKRYGFSKTGIDLSSAPKIILDNISAELESLESQRCKLEQKARELSGSIKDIEKIYDYLLNRVEKEDALSKLLNTQKTFILEGWLPENKVSYVEKLLKSGAKDVFTDFTEPLEEDVIPVALKNNAFVEPFEVITSMYSLPQHSEIDPTPVIAPFFMLFFGMMMADIGYGLLMLVGAAFALKFMDIDGGTKKMVKLILYCSAPTILFGWLYGSFFGGIIKITPLWVDPVQDTMTVLYASMALGLIHLFFGLGIKGYMLIRAGKILDAVYDVFFWYALILGLVWMLLGGSTAAQILSVIGAVGLLLTQGRANPTIVGKFFGGLYGLYGITGYLGDTLSYSRLLALGLASGLIGWSFNLLIGLLGTGPVVYIAGPIIFIAGHLFNFLVGGLGTFVHTCRLQYLEFFGKFYEGGGKAFTPLTINTKFIKLKNE